MKELKHAQRLAKKICSNIAQQQKLCMETSTKVKAEDGAPSPKCPASSVERNCYPLVSVFSYSSVASCDPWWLTPSFCNTLTNSGISFLRLFLALYWICPHSDVIGLICSMAVKRLSFVVGALLHAPFLRTGTWILCHIIIFLYSNQIVQCFTILAKPLLVSLS